MRSARAIESRTSAEGCRSRPCSSRFRYSLLIPASMANSARRNPASRRRGPDTIPTSAGVTRARRARRYSPRWLALPTWASLNVALPLPASTGLPSPGCGSTRTTTTEQSPVLRSLYTLRRTIIMTSTASDTPESDLLDTVITAHGDLDRWRSLDQLTAKVSAGGVLWGLKCQPGILKDYTLTLTPNLQSATMAPFAAPDLR